MIKPHLIDQAFQWVCAQRRNYPDNADIWHLRFHWQSERARILQSLSDGNYDFAPLQSITKADGTNIHLWRSRDALVLKALTLARGAATLQPKGYIFDTLATAYWANNLIDEAVRAEKLAMQADVSQRRFYQAQIVKFTTESYLEAEQVQETDLNKSEF